MPQRDTGCLLHPPGAISRTGVLDVGLKCAHSCTFCYYSFMAEANGQHGALRKAPFRSTQDCLRIIELMADHGMLQFDITGGEPAMHPGLPQMVRRASQLGLGARVITLGQFLLRSKGPHLLDELLDAGAADFLFSLHASSEEGFRQATGGSLAKVLAAMDALDAQDFQYAANTVIHSGNVADLPRIAELAASRGVYHHNFIAFNAYYRWDTPAGIARLQAPYAEIAPPLRQAVGILEEAGAAVTVRYLPLCVAPRLARHVVGVVGVHHDPHEWMNRAGNPDREPEYCAEPLEVPLDGPRDVYALRRGALRLELADGAVDAVAQRGEGFKVFPAPCADCAAMDYCDGLDPKYILLHGLEGLEPFAQMPGSLPLTASRRAYLPAFVLKRRARADVKAVIARLLGRRPLHLPDHGPHVSAVVDAGPGAEATAAALEEQAGVELELLRCDPNLPRAEARNRAAGIARGPVLAFFHAGAAPEPRVLAAGVEFLTQHPHCSLAGAEPAGPDALALLTGEPDTDALILRSDAFCEVGGFRDGLEDCLERDLRLALAAAGHFGGTRQQDCRFETTPCMDQAHPAFRAILERSGDIFPRETVLQARAAQTEEQT